MSTRSLCFLAGDIFSTSFYLLYANSLTHLILKAIGVVIVGILGGVAGAAGKELWPILKKWLKNIYKRLKTKTNNEKLPEETE